MQIRRRSVRTWRARTVAAVVVVALAAITVPLTAAPAQAARPTTKKLVVAETHQSSYCDTQYPGQCSSNGPTATERDLVTVAVPAGGSASVEFDSRDRQDYDTGGSPDRGCGPEPWEHHLHGEWRTFVVVVSDAAGAEVSRQAASASSYVGELNDQNTHFGSGCSGPFVTTTANRSTAEPRLVDGPPADIDCGGGRVLTGAQLDQMVADARANGATPAQVTDLDENPCEVLLGLFDGLEVQEPLLLAANQFERTADGHVCGVVQERFPFKFRYGGWRGWPFGNVNLDDTVATIDVRQYLCKDQLGVVLDNGSAVDYSVPNQPKATQPPNPEVDVNVFGFTWLMAISKAGFGNSGVSSAYWVQHNGFPKAGWRITVELELTLLGAGGGGGFAAWKRIYTRTVELTVDDIPNV